MSFEDVKFSLSKGRNFESTYHSKFGAVPSFLSNPAEKPGASFSTPQLEHQMNMIVAPLSRSMAVTRRRTTHDLISTCCS